MIVRTGITQRVLQQKIAAASLLANFYLATYELAFLERLAAVMLNVQEPQSNRDLVEKIMTGFVMTGRFIDDLLSINKLYMPYLLYIKQSLFYPDATGIYPDTLVLSLAYSRSSIPHMDIAVGAEPGGRRRLTTQLYDKRKHPPLSDVFVIKYPHISSNKQQIFTGVIAKSRGRCQPVS